jgi:hypothetical protein
MNRHFEFHRKDRTMPLFAGLIRAITAFLLVPPPVPCCAAAIRWASIR